ncbi:MAG: hypothetical protein MI924_02290 [Chloroflexales bacterium]|nr:hypothetical protein [Chloroflexales bacterium]
MGYRRIRNVSDAQRLVRRAIPQRREQIAHEWARLEHEKVRLNRELALWRDHQRRTEERLAAVETRLALLQEALMPEQDKPATPPALRTRQPAQRLSARPPLRRQSDSSASSAPSWSKVKLDY